MEYPIVNTVEEIKALIAILDHEDRKKAKLAREALERLFINLTDRSQKYEDLLNTVFLMNNVQDLNELLTIMIKIARRISDSEGSSLILVNNLGALDFIVVVGPNEDEVKRIKLKYGEGIVGECINRGTVLNIHDVYKYPGWAGRERIHDLETRNVLCVPMIHRETKETFGAIEVVNKNHYEKYTDQDIAFLKLLAINAAFSIELLRKRAK